MATGASDKTFHLKWNNHLQNLSQLFTTIYSSSALADVTLSCRDGTIKAHKLVLSACSPYFEQLFKENPCKHPIVILKGIPYQEINLLVEFMYKGSVDVQELDLQSLMHTASELEIRGLAYEIRANASQLLNVNLEYPADAAANFRVQGSQPQEATVRTPTTQADMQRLKEIHLYQQQQILAKRQHTALAKKRRLEEDGPNPAVDNILAAAAKEIALKKTVTAGIQTEEDSEEQPKQKKRVSFGCIESEDGQPRRIALSGSPPPPSKQQGGIKVVNLSQLQDPQMQDPQTSDSEDSDQNLLQEKGSRIVDLDALDETESSDSDTESYGEQKKHVCDICNVGFSRSTHLTRHKLKHTGERPYTCGGCGKSFSRSDKLRLHQRICEKDDPTVDLGVSTSTNRPDASVRPGCVRASHPDSAGLVFTAAGDVVLASQHNVSIKQELNNSSDATPGKRGRGRPRKNPLPEVPKIKKRRGRPPKLDSSLLLGGSQIPSSLSITSGMASSNMATSIQNMALTGLPTMVPTTDILPSQELLLKRRRGRPPKNFFQQRIPGANPKENYNATNLPFGDFNFLMYNAQYALNQYQNMANANQQHDFLNLEKIKVNSNDTDNSNEHEQQNCTQENPLKLNEGDLFKDVQRTINLSSSSSSEEDNADTEKKDEEEMREEQTEEREKTQEFTAASDNDKMDDDRNEDVHTNEPPEIITVGECEIVKLPPSTDESQPKVDESVNDKPVNSTDVTITPVKQVDECPAPQHVDSAT